MSTQHTAATHPVAPRTLGLYWLDFYRENVAAGVTEATIIASIAARADRSITEIADALRAAVQNSRW